MTEAERNQMLSWLDESRSGFFAAIEGLSDAQWNWKSAPGRWSIGETAEHIVLAEALLFGTARRALAAPPNPDCDEQTKGKTELIVRVMPARRGAAQSPEPIRPRGALQRTDVVERFERQRADIVEFVAGTQLALKSHTAEHPFPFFGTLNAWQWLIYVPLHSLRHIKQIAEVKATPGYPGI
jgi:hypothetical protein